MIKRDSPLSLSSSSAVMDKIMSSCCAKKCCRAVVVVVVVSYYSSCAHPYACYLDGGFFSIYITITTTATTHDISTLFWNKMAKEKVIIVWRHGREIRAMDGWERYVRLCFHPNLKHGILIRGSSLSHQRSLRQQILDTSCLCIT
jgi:hypothetical protein